MSRLSNYFYLGIAGFLFFLMALFIASLFLRSTTSQKPMTNPSATSSVQETEKAVSDDESYFGLSTTTPPIITDQKIIFIGTAKVPEVSQVEVKSDIPDSSAVIAGVDSESGRWVAEIWKSGLEGLVAFTFSAYVSDQLKTVERKVQIPSSGTVEVGSNAKTLNISFLDEPKKVTAKKLAKELGVKESELSPAEESNQSEFYKVGTVTDGVYNGDDLLIVLAPCQGICFDKSLMRMIVDKERKRLINLSAYGYSRDDVFIPMDFDGNQKVYFAPGNIVVDDSGLIIAGHDLAETYSIKDSLYSFKKGQLISKLFLEKKAKVGETTDGRTIFVDVGGCLFLEQTDHTFLQYDLVLPFVGNDGTPAVTWVNNVRNEESYSYSDVGGCGSSNCYAVRGEAEVKPAERLTQIGTTSNNEKVFGLKNSNDKELKEIYDSYAQYRDEKISFEKFASDHPLFYWQDPFGRWIRFVKNNFLSAVECGKPVIYLYPQREMPVHVSVALRGAMSKSEPEHGARGWSVTARPDGYVQTLDGKTYPNLFLEGTGVNYKVPDQGFVIKGAEADTWLKTTLEKIGFTERESAEFREFWLTRLPKTPYLFITFVSQKYFDRDASLLITPRPDSVTRVFMEYRGLDAPISVEPLTLPKIVRRGFTVVEWGGALRK